MTGTVAPKPGTSQSKERRWLALGVVLGSALGLVVLSMVVLWAASGTDDFAETARLVYASLLPLLGTWVGTVLAYYFSKDNFEVASQRTREQLELALQQRLKTLMVEPNMRTRATITAITIPKDKTEKDVSIQSMLGMLQGVVTRVPVFDGAGCAEYVVHKSVLWEFIGEKTTERAAKKKPFHVSKATLEHLLGHGNMRDIVSIMVFIRPTATLAEAKAAMERKPGCQDVFVTQSGGPDQPVLGWLTNTRIQRLSQA